MNDPPTTRTGDLVKLSKFMSLVLRHDPSAGGVTLDSKGWTPIADLMRGLRARGFHLRRSDIDTIVNSDNKARFAVSSDQRRIRANQGHSVAGVDLAFEPVEPPDTLFHGTSLRVLPTILREGLCKMQRHHVHLSGDAATAVTIGKRHGKPVVFAIDTRAMRAEGHAFYCSENGVWLADAVPAAFLKVVWGQPDPKPVLDDLQHVRAILNASQNWVCHGCGHLWWEADAYQCPACGKCNLHRWGEPA